VQRDLLPLVEGTTVSTRYGMVKTDHILFIASGAFHLARPSDLIPELQGRFPIRVELDALGVEDFVRILTSTHANLVQQYEALLATEGATLEFAAEAIRRIAEIAHEVNEKTENIGARRLYTVLEKLLEEVSFEGGSRGAQRVVIDAAYVNARLTELAKERGPGPLRPLSVLGARVVLARREAADCAAQERQLPVDVAAARADCEMNAQRDALAERELAIEPLRDQPRRFLAREHLHPPLAPVGRNQLCSRHWRNAIRARYRSTQQCVAVTLNSLQISSVSSPRCSRIRKACAVRAGKPLRHFSSAAKNCFCSRAESGSLHAVGRSCQWSFSLEFVAELPNIRLFVERPHGRLAGRLADRVDDLVLEDPGQPGAQVRLPAKTGFSGERRQQGFLHGILGCFRIAQLQARVAQQVGALVLDLGAEIRGHAARGA
jgi:hypothetical protein